MAKSHKPRTQKPKRARGTPGVQIPPSLEEELREAVGNAAKDTAPRELLEFVGVGNGGSAYEISRGIFFAMWDAMSRHGDFAVLEALAKAVGKARVHG
jgi:hypothetical protein